jgi:hypothetical protein
MARAKEIFPLAILGRRAIGTPVTKKGTEITGVGRLKEREGRRYKMS